MKPAIMIFLSIVTAAFGGISIHVSPKGTSKGDGSSERPFATLEQARDHIRTGRKNGDIKKDEEIIREN